MINELIEQLRKEWPATFAGTQIDELSGGAIAWGTIQNRRSRKEIPAECFVHCGNKVLVVRDRFLDWWGTQLTEKPSLPVMGAAQTRAMLRASRAGKGAGPDPEFDEQ